MPFFVYILTCKDDYLYTGITNNLERRVEQHQIGFGSRVTKNRRPLSLVYQEEFLTRKQAAEREKEIKGWKREKKENLIRES